MERIDKPIQKYLKKIEEKNSSTQSGKKFTRCKGCDDDVEITYEQWMNRAEVFCNSGCEEKYNNNIKKQGDSHRKAEAEHIIGIIIPEKYKKIETDRIDLFKQSLLKNVYLHGTTGTGKTVFAASLAKEYVRMGRKVEWISFPAFIMRLQNTFNKPENDKSAFDIAEECAKWDVLFIDDLGAEKLTDYVRQMMYFIINEREQRCLLTIITSNFSLSDLDEQIDPRISSRIAGMCKVIKMSGDDRRLNKVR